VADTQTIPLGTEDTPADWTIDTAHVYTLGAVYAEFDGTGAGGDFIPVLEVISDSGHKVVAVPGDDTVTAGDTAQQTWAPRLRHIGSSTPSAGSIKAIHLETTTAITVVPGNDRTITFDVVSGFDTSVFTVATSGGRVTRVFLHQQGVYAFMQWLDWGSVAGIVKATLYNLNSIDTIATFPTTMPNDPGTHIGMPVMNSYTRTVPDVAPFGDGLPTWFEFWVSLDAPGNHVTNIVYWDIQYLGATDF